MITERLELVAATLGLCQAEADGPGAVARVLGAQLPNTWPPPVFEADDVERIRRRLAADATNQEWTLHYVVLRPVTATEPRRLVGVAGYAGPPTADGQVEVGYAIAAEHQRRGYATEAVSALVGHAFLDRRVATVCATTYESLAPSIRVLQKTGFARVASDPATGRLRYERRRQPPAPRPPAPGGG
jgi:RimJ/RimL family protein N-acetyltransferase